MQEATTTAPCTMVTLFLPTGQIRLPLAGAQSLAYDLGEGLPERVYAALSVLGMGDQAALYRSTKLRLDDIVKKIDTINMQAPVDAFFAEGPQADALHRDAGALRAECSKYWTPIQAAIDIARQAVDEAGFDGAPA